MLNRHFELPPNKRRQKCSPLVLVVDDNEDNIFYACASLDLYDCQHLAAHNAQTALDLAKDKIPDLILMDIVMPKVDGMSIAKVLKSNLVTSKIPIIAVTGLTLPHQKEQILNAGFDDYLCKPYYIEELADKIACFLGYFSYRCPRMGINRADTRSLFE